MTSYTLRLFKCTADDYKERGNVLEEIIKRCPRISDYWFHFEIGDKKKTPHLQGWVVSDYSESQWDNSRDNKFRVELKKEFGVARGTYSLAKMNYPNYRSYVANNKDKNLDDIGFKVWTSYDQDVIDSFPEYIPGGEEAKPRKRTETWKDLVYKELEEKFLLPTFKEGEFTIDYVGVKNFVIPRLHKNTQISEQIVSNLLNGLILRLEHDYPHKNNKRLTKKLDDFISDKYDDVFY